MADDNDSQRTVLIFGSLYDLLDVVLMFLSFILQICKLFQNYWQKVSHNISSQNVWELLSKFGTISFQACFKRKRSLVFFRWSDLQTKEGQRHSEFPLGGLDNNSRKQWLRPRDNWEDNKFVLYPSTTIYRPFLKHCTLTNKAVGAMWRTLSKPPQRRWGYCSSSPLIVRRDSCSPLTLARVQTPRII